MAAVVANRDAITVGYSTTGDRDVDVALNEIRDALNRLLRFSLAIPNPVKAGGVVTGSSGAFIGTGATVRRVSTGRYEITLDVPFPIEDGHMFVQVITPSIGIAAEVFDNPTLLDLKTVSTFDTTTALPFDAGMDFAFVVLKWRHA